MIHFSSIKSRLIFAMSALTLFVLITSSFGLKTIGELEEQINYITDEASPVVEETDDLVATLWESAKVANEILASENPQEVTELAAELELLSQQFVATNNRLKRIVDDASYVKLLSDVTAQQQQIIKHSRDMVVAHQNELAEEAKARALLARFDQIGAQLIVALDEFANENEAEMQSAENYGDSVVASGGDASSVNDVLGELFESDYPVVKAALKLQRLVMEMQDTSGEYLAEEDPLKLDPIKAEFDALALQARQFFAVLDRHAETEEDKQDTVALIRAFDDWIVLASADEKLFDSFRDQLQMESRADQLTELLEQDTDTANAILKDIARTSDEYMESADKNAASSVAYATTLQITIIVLAVFVCLGMIFLLLRLIIKPISELSDSLHDIAQGEGDLTRRVDDSADNEIGLLAKRFNLFVEKIQGVVRQISGSATEVAGSVGQMDNLLSSVTGTIRQQNTETDSTATAINELSTNAAQISRNIDQVSSSTSLANSEGQQARQVVESTMKSIEQLAGEIKKSSDVIQALNSETNNIGEVLTVIRGIAEQTNLLALNAAIEAARAGEQGRGFAVVADEVRTLAARTQSSTEEIQVMIEKLQQGSLQAVESMELSRMTSETTVEQVNKSGQILDKISDSVNQIDDMVEQTNVAMREQSEVTESINVSINSIVESAQGVSDSADDTQRHASMLNQLGLDLTKMVSQFKV